MSGKLCLEYKPLIYLWRLDKTFNYASPLFTVSTTFAFIVQKNFGIENKKRYLINMGSLFAFCRHIFNVLSDLHRPSLIRLYVYDRFKFIPIRLPTIENVSIEMKQYQDFKIDHLDMWVKLITVIIFKFFVIYKNNYQLHWNTTPFT